jgi:hypothetical protein
MSAPAETVCSGVDCGYLIWLKTVEIHHIGAGCEQRRSNQSADDIALIYPTLRLASRGIYYYM